MTKTEHILTLHVLIDLDSHVTDCEYCHATVPIKKLKTRSRKTDTLNFIRSIKILTKYPRISYE